MSEEVKIKFPIITSEELIAMDKKIMEDFDNIVDTAMKHIYKDRECIALQKIIKEQQRQIEKQQKEIEALEIIHNTYKEMIEENNYISKDKIREKINECRKLLYCYEKDLYVDKGSMSCIIAQISILQSLLEEE